jgi:Predicted acyltransferase
MTYQLIRQVRDNVQLRNSFMDLAKSTFDLSFQNWYQKGYWSNKYIPYCIVNHDQVVANVSVNLIDFSWRGRRRHYLQIGTVMTNEKYRHQGLSRKLIRTALGDWQTRVDAIYLFANDSVLNFYPKFNFVEAKEYQYQIIAQPTAGDFRRLNMENEVDKKLLQFFYKQSNPYSAFSMEDNYGLLMFYCDSFLSNNLYYSEQDQVIVVAEQDGIIFTCWDIFGSTRLPLQTILNQLVGKETTVQLGFTPMLNDLQFHVRKENDETLFVYRTSENLFSDRKLMFPLLSHA